MMIDIREEGKYLEGHLPGAINIPFFKLYLNPEQYLNPKNEYTLYCDSGSKSKILVSYLNKLGYHCVNLEGGYFKNLLR